MNYYRLSVYKIFEDADVDSYEEIYFFKTKQEAEDFKNEYDEERKRNDGSYCRGIHSIYYDIDEVSYEEMKEEITVSQFEEIFNVVL